MNVFSRAYIDSLYQDYQQDPSSLPPQWQQYFATFDPDAEDFDPQKLPSSTGTLDAAVHNAQHTKSIAIQQDRVDQLMTWLELPKPT